MYLAENLCEMYEENTAQRKSSDLDKYRRAMSSDQSGEK